eukprot:gene3678-4613_t
MPHHNWLRYEDGLRMNPVLTKACISGFVYGFGDWIAQVYKNGGLLNFDRKRILSAVTIGFIGHGPLSHYYFLFADELFQPLHLTGTHLNFCHAVALKDGAAEPLAKVAFDQTIWSGVWNSIYFTMMGCLRGDSIPTTMYFPGNALPPERLGKLFAVLLSLDWPVSSRAGTFFLPIGCTVLVVPAGAMNTTHNPIKEQSGPVREKRASS